MRSRRILYKVSLLYSYCMFLFRKIPGNSQDSARKRPQMDRQLEQGVNLSVGYLFLYISPMYLLATATAMYEIGVRGLP